MYMDHLIFRNQGPDSLIGFLDTTPSMRQWNAGFYWYYTVIEESLVNPTL